jgi:PAS domain S-box-containing protein
LRHPLLAALALAAAYPLLHLAVIPFIAQGLLVNRLDYALDNLTGTTLAVGTELLIGGLLAELIRMLSPQAWGAHTPLEPSPAERSLRTRFLVGIAPLAVALVLALGLGNWVVAQRAARNLLRTQMSSAAQTAADSLPYFLETGQSLILSVAADPLAASDDPQALGAFLEESLRQRAFFDQLAVLGQEGEVVGSFPARFTMSNETPADLLMGLQAAFNGMPFQYYTTPPLRDQQTAQVAFVAPVSSDSTDRRVLIGYSDLASNPLIQPAIASLDNLADMGGDGMLLDENLRILAHPDPARVWEPYAGRAVEQPDFFDDAAPDGTRLLVFFQPSTARNWAVVQTVPARQVQQVALSIAAPLMVILLVLAFLAIIMIRLSLNVITRSLQSLAGEAGRLAEGRLDRPVSVESTDEVGQLGRAFEQMRVSLKARLDDLARLLAVSQGVASSLEISEAVQPVLESALNAETVAVRVTLTPAPASELDGAAGAPQSFGMGLSSAQYQYLDEQILALTRQQDRLVLSNLYRPKLLNFAAGVARPESLMAVALKHENQYYGALWVAYDQPHTFSEEEVRFLVTLGGQAALAAANARLYLNAEIGRKRLESILASTPDPVLVTDQNDCLLLANPAAWQVLGLGVEAGEGAPIDQIVKDNALLDILRSGNPEKQTVEVYLPGSRVYLASATAVLAEGRRMGRVCVLRDITHLKELDDLKSDFVSTVSHDLRGPLTLMRGYATMLEMVGQLNEQQVGYVRKIVSGVEDMSRLVNNLLDLGRIEAGVGLNLELAPIVDIVERVVNAMQLQAAQKHITLTMEFPQQTIPLVEADPALLRQALQNLLENAIKFTRADGKILVRVQIQPSVGGLLIQVIDNGIGVSPMDLPRLFEKFYRGAQQSKDERGTGLGLAIVRSIAERHGGRAWAESQLGKGSTFYISLPLRQTKRVAEAVGENR